MKPLTFSFFFTLSLLLLHNNTAIAAGFQFKQITDPKDKTFNVGIWYPSDEAVPDKPNTPFKIALARDAKVSGSQLPLVVISHGYGGGLGGHATLATMLADAGFVVIAPTHTGNNYEDESYPASKWMVDRPRHISLSIDYMHKAWKQRDVLDKKKTAMYGFSAGGYTAMVTAGAEVDIKQLLSFCEHYPQEVACELSVGLGFKNSKLAGTEHIKGKDNRIKATIAVAPAFGFAFSKDSLSVINTPIQIWAGDLDKQVLFTNNVSPIVNGMSHKPEVKIVKNAGHYVFRAPCNPALEKANPRIWNRVCVDKEGFDRDAFHIKHNTSVLLFLQQSLNNQ